MGTGRMNDFWFGVNKAIKCKLYVIMYLVTNNQEFSPFKVIWEKACRNIVSQDALK